MISRVLLDQAGRDKLDACGARRPAPRGLRAVLESAKLRVLDTIMASEFTVLVQLLSRIAAGHYSTRDYSADRLREALRLYVLEFPIYRTYVTAAGLRRRRPRHHRARDRRGARRWFGTDRDIFDFLRDALTLDLIGQGRPPQPSAGAPFALKMQQFTGPMMAKSLEDTAFYRYHALLALNEVGGDRPLPALSIAEFHERMAARAARPHGLTATATHDTKRGEDARMRILALSELPERGPRHVAEWRRLNVALASHRRMEDEARAQATNTCSIRR